MSSSVRMGCYAVAVFTVTAACSDNGASPPSPDASRDVSTDVSVSTDGGTATDVSVSGDVGNISDVGVSTDGGTATDVIVLADASTDAGADGSADSGASACTLAHALVATSNYAMGAWAFGSVATPSSIVASATDMDQDHIGVQSGCVVFDLERSNDAVDVLDPAHLPTVLHHVSLRPAMIDAGMGYYANPQDVLVLNPHRAYVAQLSLPRLAILDPTLDGAAALVGTVDLTPITQPTAASASGSPSPVAFAQYGGRVYLALQNLDSSYAPAAAGVLAAIDPATDALVDLDTTTAGVQGITLTGRNPQSMVPAGAGRVVLGEAGVIAFAPPQVLDGVVEAVDLVAGHPVAGQRVTEMQLGGDVSNVVMFDATHGWAAVTVLGTDGGASVTNIMPFDLAAGTVGTRVVQMQTSPIGGMALAPDGTVWVPDRTSMASGVRVFQQSGTELTAHPVATGAYPPYGIAFTP